ncbi:MAG: FAD-binding oxidoreductase [Acidimicrobiales bacterium]
MTPVDRRSFLRQAGGALALTGAGIAGAGCSSPHRGRPGRTATSTTSSTATSHPSSPVRSSVSPAAWASLRASLSGRLVLPKEPAYPADKLVYDLRFAGISPAGIAYCASPADVQRCIGFARRHALPIAARSGGHSYGGYSTGNGLVVDVTAMSAVSVLDRRSVLAGGSTGPTATVGSGTLLIDLYSRLSAAGVVLPGGSCPTVGIAGLTLGGGIGVVGRKYGLTCDNLLAFEIVTADGSVVRCDPGNHEDLFWAGQGGGGGNFGIVTSFVFGVHPMPELSLFTLDWPWASAADVLGAWQAWAPHAPDELWSNCQLLSGGPTGLQARVTGVLVGNAGTLASLLHPFERAVGAHPTYRFVGPESYMPAMLVEAGCQGLTVPQCHLPEQDPSGMLPQATFVAKSAYVSRKMPAAGLQAAAQLASDLQASQPGVNGGLVFDSYGGAINRVTPDATAFVHRRTLCGIQTSVSWAPNPSAAAVAAGRAWLVHAADTLAPYTDGSAYQNYIDPTLADWQQAYYGANLDRLIRVKKAYDPDDVFHFAQSIPTRVGA